MFKIATGIKLIALLTLIFTVGIYSQGDIAIGKVKAAISNMPEQILAGETVKVTVTITNTGTVKWSSENAHGKELGPFEIDKEWSGVWTLEPGESKDVYYKVTAPNKPGNYKMRIVIYNGDKKIGYRSKKVEVTGSSIK